MSDKANTQALEAGTYEIIRDRLQQHRSDLEGRLQQLNDLRKQVFGSVETQLIAQNRIATENNCIAQDITALGNLCILGYNVHFGLRTDIKLDDVFSTYYYNNGEFETATLDIISDQAFVNDFSSLYKYYRSTKFYRFITIGNYLYMLFQLSDRVGDLKAFKWLVADDKLTYVDNRSDYEYRFPAQHDYSWQPATRDMQRYGKHPHVAVLNKVFIDTLGGTLTVKVEDNTNEGEGIYNEPVENADQRLDDALIQFADLGNLIALEIKPFQEESRYFVYNHKLREIKRINSIGNAAILLPDEQGIIFANGYYLQSGEYKVFENTPEDVVFQERISSPNGEDFLYVFYQQGVGRYVLMMYNVIAQTVNTPIICNGYSILEGGRLCYFTSESEQTRSHVVQVWQTPFTDDTEAPAAYKDSLVFKIGNKNIVRGMADSRQLITLLQKEDNYSGLYNDLVRFAQNILDAYFWIQNEEVFNLSVPLTAIKNTANAAIDEFEKVTAMRQRATQAAREINEKVNATFSKLKAAVFHDVRDFVQHLTALRTLRGEIISLREIRYIDMDMLANMEAQTVEQTERTSRHCVTFLSDPKALQPFADSIKARQQQLEDIKRVVDGKSLETEVNQIGTDLEMLVDIVSNLQIEDTTQATQIIDGISLLFTSLNQLKAAVRNKVTNLAGSEASAQFAAQMKLIDQTIVNYLDIADTPEKTDELMNRLAVQLEELEARFASYDPFVEAILEKREEAGSAFDTRKAQLLEERNKRAVSIETAAGRILRGIAKKAGTLASQEEINGYFAGDLMISKLRDMVQQLRGMDDAGRAESIETALKSAREEALRKLKDRNELYEDGENIIRLGNHRFAVNRQALDLTIILRDNQLLYHLTGTDFYAPVHSSILLEGERFWSRSLLSENQEVYRAAYLAWKLWRQHGPAVLHTFTDDKLKALIAEDTSKAYDEGYTKGVHDEDALAILRSLLKKHHGLGRLVYPASTRAAARFFWESLDAEARQHWQQRIQASGQVLAFFPNSSTHSWLVEVLSATMQAFFAQHSTLLTTAVPLMQAAHYLFDEVNAHAHFCVSLSAFTLYEDMLRQLQLTEGYTQLRASLEHTTGFAEKIQLARQWVAAYLQSLPPGNHGTYLDEVVACILFRHEGREELITESEDAVIEGLAGAHPTIDNGKLAYNYHAFTAGLQHFFEQDVPAFMQFRQERHKLIQHMRQEMRLEEFEPKVLSSFVRNKLINQVYLPLIGDNLARQLGASGDGKRTDRSGMLLLVSPPGYGKTTLMEYVASRLGLIFMKINGPALGHTITSVDPESADNSAAREELKKLNLALEMGNNVMLYVDDIQHCNPEFLQKFISLADGTRRMEGVYMGRPRTYDLKSKRFCVVMAGNPYTESGEKFKIPDMLANRSDIYNLGDIIGNTADLFKLSLIENAVTSNTLLSSLVAKQYDDLYTLIDMVERNTREGLELKGNHSKQEVETFVSLLQKIIAARNLVLQVNALYISSAAQDDAYRTEPSFKLQGSYRDMNKIVSKVLPIMNDEELQSLLLSHYRNESQTLTSAAEANMLKLRELMGLLTADEQDRWASIKETFVKNNRLRGMGDNTMAMLLNQVETFTGYMGEIKQTIAKK